MFKEKILATRVVTHDVKQFIIQKPQNYKFIPGQATEVAILKEGLEKEKRPFTFTSLNNEPILEFTIKEYPERDGVTKKLHQLKTGNEISLEEPFGAINYKGEGTFIAGGAGITPFIAIFRQLQFENNQDKNFLIFTNKTWKDIILERELINLLGKENVTFTLTEENIKGYDTKRIDKGYLKKNIDDFDQKFYLCGPPLFVKEIKDSLLKLGAKEENIIQEE